MRRRCVQLPARGGRTGDWHVVLVVENLPMGADHRLRKQVETLLARGGRWEGRVSVVWNGPVLARVDAVGPSPHVRAADGPLVVWVGKMGVQDRVELVVEAAERVINAGEPEETVFGYLAGADAGIDTSLQHEVTPVKALEYMSFGFPFVAFDLPETRRLAGDAAVLAPPGDVDALARSLVELIDDEPRRTELGRA